MVATLTGIVAGGAIIALLYGAWYDLATRTVPNSATILVAATGIMLRAMVSPSALAVSVALAAGLFCALVAAHAHGLLGGGDVKLIAAIALGLPPAGSLHLLMATALGGGVLALIHLALRILPHPARSPPGSSDLRRIWTIERWRIRRHAPLPYGVAIAAAGTWVFMSTVWS